MTDNPDDRREYAASARIARTPPASDDYLADLIRRVNEDPDSLTPEEQKLMLVASERLAKAVREMFAPLVDAFAPLVSAFAAAADSAAAVFETFRREPHREDFAPVASFDPGFDYNVATDDLIAAWAERASISWTEAWDAMNGLGFDMTHTSPRIPD